MPPRGSQATPLPLAHHHPDLVKLDTSGQGQDVRGTGTLGLSLPWGQCPAEDKRTTEQGSETLRLKDRRGPESQNHRPLPGVLPLTCFPGSPRTPGGPLGPGRPRSPWKERALQRSCHQHCRRRRVGRGNAAPQEVLAWPRSSALTSDLAGSAGREGQGVPGSAPSSQGAGCRLPPTYLGSFAANLSSQAPGSLGTRIPL